MPWNTIVLVFALSAVRAAPSQNQEATRLPQILTNHHHRLLVTRVQGLPLPHTLSVSDVPSTQTLISAASKPALADSTDAEQSAWNTVSGAARRPNDLKSHYEAHHKIRRDVPTSSLESETPDDKRTIVGPEPITGRSDSGEDVDEEDDVKTPETTVSPASEPCRCQVSEPSQSSTVATPTLVSRPPTLPPTTASTLSSKQYQDPAKYQTVPPLYKIAPYQIKYHEVPRTSMFKPTTECITLDETGATVPCKVSSFPSTTPAQPVSPSAVGQSSRPVSSFTQSQTAEFNGSFSYSFETENGVSADVKGGYMMIVTSEQNEGQRVIEGQYLEGQYSYTAPDGTTIKLRWYADETGLHKLDFEQSFSA